MDDGGTWFFNSKNLDLSFELVDRGYDVWITNSRGTVYSNSHVTKKIENHDFWDFTFNEMGKYDVPANLHYILNTTGAEQIVYFGHSQGTTQFFVANALFPEINKFYKGFIALAPVAHVGHQTSILGTVLSILEIPEAAYGVIDSLGYMPRVPPLFQSVIHKLPRTVWAGISTIVGYDVAPHIDFGFLPMIVRNDVGGTSTKNLFHWAQNMRSGEFRQFDYGKQKNMEVYGQENPTTYDLESFKTRLAHLPMMFFVGHNDVLCNPKDFKFLEAVISQETTQVKWIEDYNHLDYMWAKDANDYINNDVL